MPEDDQQRSGFRVQMTPGDWLKLGGYVLSMFIVYFQMDSRVHALELVIAQIRLDGTTYARADVAKVQNDGIAEQLREITRRLGNIETKVDGIETKR